MQSSFVIQVPSAGQADSDPLGPHVGFCWRVKEFACEAPAGTEGAILWYQQGTLRKVDGIGEFTSLEYQGFMDVPDHSPLTARFVGVSPGQVRLTLVYETRRT